MKRIVFLFLVMCSLTSSYSQDLYETKRHLTDEERNYTDTDLDNAYAAPLTKFIGKKWYQGWNDTEVRYWIFNNDKTGAIVNEFTVKYYSAPVQVVKKRTFRWKRNGNDLTITLTPHLDVDFPIESSMSKLSPRVKAEVKKDCATMQEKMREKTYSDYNIIGRITKITNDIFIFCDPRGYSYTGFEGDDVIGFVSKKRFDEMVVKQKARKAEEEAREKAREEAIKKEQEEAKKKEEEKRIKAEKERQLTDELEKVNAQAYSYMHEGKYDEAVAAINTAIEKQPDNPNWYDSKGEILYMKGDKEGAKAMWDKVISLDSNFPNSVLRILMTNKGWIPVNENFPYYIPFKKIRVLNQSWGQWSYCCAFFNSKPDNRPKKEDTNIAVNFFSKKIIFESLSTKYKNCTDVGNGWVEYEFSKYVYFSHYQQNAPKDRLMILIE